MKQREIIAAYKALLRLSEQVLPIKKAWAIAKARAALEAFWEFQLSEERRFFSEHTYTVEPNGQIVFLESGVDDEFRRRMIELGDLDQDVTVERFTLSIDDSISLSARDIDALSWIVNFEGSDSDAVDPIK